MYVRCRDSFSSCRMKRVGHPAGAAAQARARVINRLIIGRFLGRIVAGMDRKCELLRRAFTRANCCISDPRCGFSFCPRWLIIELHFSLPCRRIRLSGDARDFRGRAQLYRYLAKANRWIIYGGVIVSLLSFYFDFTTKFSLSPSLIRILLLPNLKIWLII